MFGYVIADLARLAEGQQTRYKSFYSARHSPQ